MESKPQNPEFSNNPKNFTHADKTEYWQGDNPRNRKYRVLMQPMRMVIVPCINRFIYTHGLNLHETIFSCFGIAFMLKLILSWEMCLYIFAHNLFQMLIIFFGLL